MIDIAAILRLDGKVAIVTGGSKGIGFSTAEHFVAAGASVLIVARGKQDLEAAVGKLQADGGQVLGIAGDANDPAVRADVVTRCVDEFGRLDILVNNAASGGPVGPLIEADQDAVREVVEHDQLTPLFWSQAAYRGWMGAHSGAIVNITSFAGIRARPNYGAYGHAKAALDHQTRVLALELAPKVRVNSVAPGLVVTHMMMQGTTPEYRRMAAEQRPMRRLGDPEDIARAVLFLCSDAASWITGLVFPVEGGAILAS